MAALSRPVAGTVPLRSAANIVPSRCNLAYLFTTIFIFGPAVGHLYFYINLDMQMHHTKVFFLSVNIFSAALTTVCQFRDIKYSLPRHCTAYFASSVYFCIYIYNQREKKIKRVRRKNYDIYFCIQTHGICFNATITLNKSYLYVD